MVIHKNKKEILLAEIADRLAKVGTDADTINDAVDRANTLIFANKEMQDTGLEEKRIGIIHKLTLLDTSSYRCVRVAENNVRLNRGSIEIKEGSIDLIDIKESGGFRNKLFNIYIKLSLTELTELYKLRNGSL